jgi:ubiquinone/menaquinone biosynthesis C-methylase UbiE
MAYTPEHLSQWNDFFIYNPASRRRREILASLVEPLEFSSVLDVGCGDGSLAVLLKEKFGKETAGLEYDSQPPRLADSLDAYYNMNIAETRPDRAFDLVIASEVLEHIPEDEAALRNIRKICSKYAVITVPSGKIRFTDKHMGHVRHYTLEDLSAKVERAGFRVRRAFAWGFPFHSLYKWAQDLAPSTLIENFGSGEYGFKAKAVCEALYLMFGLNSFSSGPQLFLLAETPEKP